MTITWNDASGELRHGVAMTQDISAGGACLRTSESIPVGATVNVGGNGRPFTGVVRHRTIDGTVYVLGLQRWDDLGTSQA